MMALLPMRGNLARPAVRSSALSDELPLAPSRQIVEARNIARQSTGTEANS